eukprot:6057512-Alexandrium_andersonii.AAC.1
MCIRDSFLAAPKLEAAPSPPSRASEAGALVPAPQDGAVDGAAQPVVPPKPKAAKSSAPAPPKAATGKASPPKPKAAKAKASPPPKAAKGKAPPPAAKAKAKGCLAAEGTAATEATAEAADQESAVPTKKELESESTPPSLKRKGAHENLEQLEEAVAKVQKADAMAKKAWDPSKARDWAAFQRSLEPC